MKLTASRLNRYLYAFIMYNVMIEIVSINNSIKVSKVRSGKMWGIYPSICCSA